MAIEALCHSRDARQTLQAITASLRPTDVGCHASHLIVADDVLLAPASTAEGSNGEADDAALLSTYKTHWAGWSGSSFPLTEPQWRDALLTVDNATRAAAGNSSEAVRKIRFVDLGAEEGLRLHGKLRLRIVAAILRAAHGAVGAFRLTVQLLGLHHFRPVFRSLESLESYLGTYQGAIARERLLLGGRLRYALITMTKT